MSQLYAATLGNTGNNNTTCKTIEDIHIHQGLRWNSDKQQLPYVLFFYLEIHYSINMQLLEVVLDMSLISETLMLCLTSQILQLLKMQLLSGNMTPHKLTTEF
jgi:hypothetical protein